MPGHIGTSIAINSRKLLGQDPKELTSDQVQKIRDRMARSGLDLSSASDEDIRVGIQAQGEAFRDQAPMSAATAATIILDAVRNDQWRVLVGDDAILLDQMVRAEPTQAYELDFLARLHAQGAMKLTDPD